MIYSLMEHKIVRDNFLVGVVQQFIVKNILVFCRCFYYLLEIIPFGGHEFSLIIQWSCSILMVQES